MNLYEKLNRLDDSLVESKRVVKKKKLTENYKEYEVYMDTGMSDEDEFFRDIRNAKRFAKDLVKRYGKLDNNAPAIIKRNNGDPLPDNWPVLYTVKYDPENDSFKLFNSYGVEEQLTESELTPWEKIVKTFPDDFRHQSTPANKTSAQHKTTNDYAQDNNTPTYDNKEVITKRDMSARDKLLKTFPDLDIRLNEGYSNEMTEFMNWIQEYRNGALWNDFATEFEAEEDPDISVVLTWLENFDNDAYYDYVDADTYDDDIDEMLIESTEQYELSTLVKDSINHLVNDLGKDSMADDFGDDVCADLENNYDIYIPENPVKYADWCDAVMSEVSRQLNNKEEQLTESKVFNDLENKIETVLMKFSNIEFIIEPTLSGALVRFLEGTKNDVLRAVKKLQSNGFKVKHAGQEFDYNFIVTDDPQKEKTKQLSI